MWVVSGEPAEVGFGWAFRLGERLVSAPPRPRPTAGPGV